MTDTHETSVDIDRLFCTLAPNWRAFIFRGVVALIIAVLAWMMPAEAVLTLTIVFGAFAFVDGVFGLWAGYRNIRAGERWGWLVFSGLLGIATGLVVLIAPLVASFVLTVFLWTMIAFWSVASGVMEILAAIRLRKEIEGEWLLMLSGAISVFLGVAVSYFLMAYPVDSLLALGWVLAIYATVFGVTMILLGIKLRDVCNNSGKDKSAKS